MSDVRRPVDSEFAPYYGRYVELVPDGAIVDTLERQRDGMLELLGTIDEERAGFRYAPGKWSLKEVVGHVIDVEWVFTYRAVRFARGDPAPLPGVDQDLLVAGADFDARSLAGLRAALHLRSANVVLFRSFGDDVLSRTGKASGVEFTVRSILWIIAGHELHHERVIRERYLDGT